MGVDRRLADPRSGDWARTQGDRGRAAASGLINPPDHDVVARIMASQGCRQSTKTAETMLSVAVGAIATGAATAESVAAPASQATSIVRAGLWDTGRRSDPARTCAPSRLDGSADVIMTDSPALSRLLGHRSEHPVNS